MKLVAVALVILTAGLAMIGCEGGSDSASKTPLTDEQAIEKLFRDYAKAFDKLDETKLMTFYSSTCTQLDLRVKSAVAQWKAFADTVDFEVTGVQVKNLTATSAEAMPEGKTIYPAQEGPITVQTFEKLVKENGEWKFSNCDFTY